MIELVPGNDVQRVLVIGAHSDDIEIGTGGTILSLLAANETIDVTWVVLATHGERRAEAAESAEQFLARAGSADIRLESFRERYLPHQPEVKEYFDSLGSDVEPDLIFCPWTGDAHQDHRTAAELTFNTFRDHLILQYEIVKVDGDLGRPNAFVRLPTEVANRKIELLMRMFPSQQHRHWYRPEVFESIMRIRGVESRARSGLAEAFHVSRFVLTI